MRWHLTVPMSSSMRAPAREPRMQVCSTEVRSFEEPSHNTETETYPKQVPTQPVQQQHACSPMPTQISTVNCSISCSTPHRDSSTSNLRPETDYSQACIHGLSIFTQRSAPSARRRPPHASHASTAQPAAAPPRPSRTLVPYPRPWALPPPAP